MRRKQQKIRPRGKMRDNSKSISVRMTEEQFQRLTRYLELTRLPVTTYFHKLIAEKQQPGKTEPGQSTPLCGNQHNLLQPSADHAES